MMTNFLTFKNNYWVVCFSLLVMIVSFSCSDLEIEETDSEITEAGLFEGVNPATALDNLYNGMYGQLGSQENIYALNEVTSDALLIPTRGTDWGDNGIWRQLHQHTWSSTHKFIFDAWNSHNQNVLLATEIIDPLSNPSAEQIAEAKVLRAFNMYMVLDSWGIAPFREPTQGAEIDPVVFSSQEAYDYIINDINDAIAGLPDGGPGDNTSRMAKAAAYFLKAKVQLNANRYKGSDSFDENDMQDVVDAVDAIDDLGYGLQSGYFELFAPDADSETIWAPSSGTGPRIWNTLHYNQNSPGNQGGGWNGFSTLAEFYDSFDGDSETNFPGDAEDERRGFVPNSVESNAYEETGLYGIGVGFLVGQQYEEDGSPLTDRNGLPLVFTKEFPGLVGNNERTGIRVIKYHPAITGGAFTAHQIIFRYSDAYLMKAEAMLRMGEDVSDMVNELRDIREADDLDDVDLDELLAERGRELYIEFWRRNDLIRFGKFTDEWEFKDPSAIGNETKNLFPIPSNALVTNPNLTQNPGY